MSLRYEAWTLPWDSDGFYRKIAKLPVVSGSGSKGFLTTSGSSRADISNFDRISELISDTEGSLVRVLDGASVVDEWFAERNSLTVQDEQKINGIQGNILPSVLDKVLIYPQDGLSPTKAGDHIWGGSNLLSNPGFEDGGSRPSEWELIIEATGGTFTLSDGTDTTDPIAYNAQAATIQTAIQDDLGLIDDVTLSGSNPASPPFIRTITAVTPATGVTLTIGTGSLTGGSGTITETTVGTILHGPWEPNKWSNVSSVDVSVFPVWEVQATTVDEGTYALAFQPLSILPLSRRHPGVQQIVSVKPGQTYQWSMRIFPTSANDLFRISIYSFPGDEFIANLSPSVTANQWNTITLNDTVIPEPHTQVRALVHWRNFTQTEYFPSVCYFDTGIFQEGFGANTLGNVASTILETAVSPGILDWLDLTSWSDTLDSSGAAWADDVNITVPWGSTVGQFLDQLVDLGYEWEIVPKTPIGQIAAGNPTHDLNIYNPGGRDDAPEVGIAPKQGVTGGATVFRIPEYTRVVVEGANAEWVAVNDASTQSAFGEMEILSRQLNLGDEATRILAGQQWLDFEAANRNAVEFSLAETSFHHRPLVDYRPGDTIAMQVPPNLPRELRRVQRVDYSYGVPTEYKVVGSRVLTGEAAAYDLIWRMWRRFKREKEVVSGGGGSEGGGSGAPTVVVAASDASEFSKSKADFVCFGINDEEIIQEAIDSISNGGRVLLTEGNYLCNVPSGGAAISLPGLIHLQGMGMDATYVLDNTLSDPGAGSSLVAMDTSPAFGHQISDLTLESFYSNTVLDASSAIRNRVHINRVNFQADAGTAIHILRGAYWWIDQCMFNLAYGGNAVEIENASDIWITNNVFLGGDRAVYAYDNGSASTTSHNIHVDNNYILIPGDQAIFFDGGRAQISFSVITNNVIQGTGVELFSYGDTASIHIVGEAGSSPNPEHPSDVGEPGVLIQGNTIESNSLQDGIRLELAHLNAVKDNHIENVSSHGIYVDDTGAAEISGNNILWPDDDDDTWDAIHVAGDSARNYIHHNRPVNDDAVNPVNAVRWRYGINIADATCEGNIVVANALGPVVSYGTDALNDSGTDTQLSYPADATYGDNFVSLASSLGGGVFLAPPSFVSGDVNQA